MQTAAHCHASQTLWHVIRKDESPLSQQSRDTRKLRPRVSESQLNFTLYFNS